MVISKWSELTSSSIKRKFPDSCLATNETSALCGTELLHQLWFHNARAWSVNLGHLSTLNITVVRRLANGSPAVKLYMGLCLSGCMRKVRVWMWVGSCDTFQQEGKNTKLQYQTTSMTALPRPQQISVLFSSFSEAHMKEFWKRCGCGLCMWRQLKHLKATCGPANAKGTRAPACVRSFITGARTWSELTSSAGVSSQSTGLLFCWDEREALNFCF